MRRLRGSPSALSGAHPQIPQIGVLHAVRPRRGSVARGWRHGGGATAGAEDAPARFCERWPLTYGNDARAGP